MSKGRKFFLGVLVIAAIVIIVVVVVRTKGIGNFFISEGGSTSDYQAVFLDNNQVYFGRLSGQNAQFPTLKDIYYLQVQNSDGGPLGPEDVSLVKLGGELHGPIDQMKINRDHILLIEDLKSDSNVVDAINRFKETGEL